MAKNTSWITTSVPADLAERVDIFVNSKEGKKSGYTSKTGFIADAIREKIDEVSGESKKQQTKLENKMEDMEMELIKIQKMLIEALSNKAEQQLKVLEELTDPNSVQLKIYKEAREKSKKQIKELEKTPQYHILEKKRSEQRKKDKIKSSKEIQKLVGPEYVAYDQDKSWMEREEESNKTKLKNKITKSS